MRGWQKRTELVIALAACGLAAALSASVAQAGGRLAWMCGVSEIEGAAGGGLVPWALIAGLGTEDEVGGSAFLTGAETAHFTLKAAGVALGVRDRFEISYARQRFDIGDVVPGVTLGQDVAGLKVKLLGDAVFDQDRWWPQLAAGVLYKDTHDFTGIPHALGARKGSGTEYYLAVTKLWLGAAAGHNVLLDVTLRRSDANQSGLLGFGGANGAEWRPEASLVAWISDRVLLGAEYRGKHGGLASPEEASARDVFIAWGPSRHVNLVLAYVDLGPIAFQTAQRGTYLSVSVLH